MKNLYHSNLPSPCWLLDEDKLQKNLLLIDYIRTQSGAKVLLALKGYALWKSFDVCKPYLNGC
jgi:carboxynorspermidine decarboxylase